MQEGTPLPEENQPARTDDRNRSAAPAPQPESPDETWPYRDLYEAVRKVLFALPAFFKTDLVVSGVAATDLFTFNSSLGATIEGQLVRALNAMRAAWDLDQKYSLYQFVRQAQRFPDVILRASTPDVEPFILMGIELKGWYVLSKESEPSFRYRVTPAVCAPKIFLPSIPGRSLM